MPPDFCMDCAFDWTDHGHALDGTPTCPDGGQPWTYLFELEGDEA